MAFTGPAGYNADLFLSTSQLNWESYCRASWRTPRAVELDGLGGIGRPPLARGRSLDGKLEYLRSAVLQQADEISDTLYHGSQQRHPASPVHGKTPASQAVSVEPDGRPSKSSDRPSRPSTAAVTASTRLAPSWGISSEQADAKREQVERRKRMIQYGQSQSDVNVPKPAEKDAPASREQASQPSPASGHKPVVQPAAKAASPAQAVQAPRNEPLPWRLRMHAARRRVLITVLTAVRFKLGNHHPNRLRRVDSFGVYVSKALGDASTRFIDEQRKAASLRSQVDTLHLLLTNVDLWATAGASSPLAPSHASASTSSTLCHDTAAPLTQRLSLQLAPPSMAPRLPQLPGADSQPTSPTAFLDSPATDKSEHSFSFSVAPSSVLAPSHPRLLQPSATQSLLSGSVQCLTPASRTVSQLVRTRTMSSRASISSGYTPAGSEQGSRLPTPEASFNYRSLQGEGGAANLVSNGPVLYSGQSQLFTSRSALSAPQQPVQTTLQPPQSPPHPSSPLRTSQAKLGALVSLAALPQRLSHQGLLSQHRRSAEQRAALSPTSRPASTRPSLEPSWATDLGSERSSAGPLTRHATSQPRSDRHSSGPWPRSGQSASARPRSLLHTSSSDSLAPGSRGGNAFLASPILQMLEGTGDDMKETFSEAVETLLSELTAVPVAHKPQWLQQTLTEKAEALAASSRMLKMFVNRANSRDPEPDGVWGNPGLWDAQAAVHSLGPSEVDIAVDRVVAALQVGAVAVQVFCGEDSLQLADGQVVDLFSPDPWQLVEALRPGCVPPTTRVEGVCLGARALLQLLAAVTALAGEVAASRLTLLLHCSDQQQGEVLTELWTRRHFGLSPDAVIIMPQPAWPGYRYSLSAQRFVRDPLGPGHSLGTGFGLFQLSWVGNGFTLSPEGSLTPLGSSVVELLEARGVMWLLSHRLRDLSLLSCEGALDSKGLALLLSLHQCSRANMAVWCAETDSVVASRRHDSVLVSRQPPGPTLGTQHSFPSTSPNPPSKPPPATFSIRSSRQPGQVQHATFHSLGVVPLRELRHGELVSPALATCLTALKQASGGRLVVGMARYAFHLPSLRAMLVGFPFHARLSMKPALTLSPLPDGLSASNSTLSITSGTSSSLMNGLPSQPSCSASSSSSSLAPPVSSDLVCVHWDIADLLALKSARCVPLRSQITLAVHPNSSGSGGSAIARSLTTRASLTGPSLAPSAPAAKPPIGISPRSSAAKDLRPSGAVAGPLPGTEAAPAPQALAQAAGPGPLPLLLGADDMPLLAQLLQRQDHDPLFRRLLAEHQSEGRQARVRVVEPEAAHPSLSPQGLAIVVLVQSKGNLSDMAVAMAVRVARPGRDVLHLVTVVATAAHVEEGEALLQHFYLAALKSLVSCKLEVLVRQPWSFLDVLEWYTVRSGCGLVVMSSAKVTSPHFHTMAGGGHTILSSTTLAAIKRLRTPVLVVTSNTRKFGDPGATPQSAGEAAVAATKVPAPFVLKMPAASTAAKLSSAVSSAEALVAAACSEAGLKVMALAERYSRPMLNWVCTKCLDLTRGDQLLLAQVVPERECFASAQQRKNYNTVLSRIEATATAAHVPVSRRVHVFGAMDVGLHKVILEEGVGLLALQLPPAGRISRHLLQLMRSSRAGVLFYKGGIGQLGLGDG